MPSINCCYLRCLGVAKLATHNIRAAPNLPCPRLLAVEAATMEARRRVRLNEEDARRR
jgi:hypothetical protein